jgi:prolyl-tRNA synthetase
MTHSDDAGWCCRRSSRQSRGVPLRMEVGPRDLEAKKVMVVERPTRTKAPLEFASLDSAWLAATSARLQAEMLKRARDLRTSRTFRCDSYSDFQARLDAGGFFLMHWDGTKETEAKIKEETKATIRCIPFVDQLDTADGPVSLREPGTDPVSGRPSQGRVIYARAY